MSRNIATYDTVAKVTHINANASVNTVVFDFNLIREIVMRPHIRMQNNIHVIYRVHCIALNSKIQSNLMNCGEHCQSVALFSDNLFRLFSFQSLFGVHITISIVPSYRTLHYYSIYGFSTICSHWKKCFIIVCKNFHAIKFHFATKKFILKTN